MKVKTVIAEIAGRNLQDLGFVFEGQIAGGAWRFERMNGDVSQYVRIVKSNHIHNALTLEFGTSLSPLFWPAQALAPSEPHWRKYTDEEELRPQIREMCHVTRQYGIPWLDAQVAKPRG